MSFVPRNVSGLKRIVTNEGLNGLYLHDIHESVEALSGFVEVTLLKEPNVVVAKQDVPLENISGGQQMLSADEVLGGFYDVSYAYRFGPPHHDVVVATLLDRDRQVISEAFHFVRRRESNVAPAIIVASAELNDQPEYAVTLQSDRFLQYVRLSAKGYLPDDNYFHLCPRRKKSVRFSPFDSASKTFRVEFEAAISKRLSQSLSPQIEHRTQ